MKKTVCILLVIITFIACKKQESVKLAAEHLYILNVDNTMPEYDDNGEDSTYILVRGLAEIGKDFQINVINRDGYRGQFLSLNMEIPDSIKSEINDMLLHYQTDTLYQEEYEPIVYDGPIYVFVIEKEKGKYTRVGPTPWTSSDLTSISKMIFEDNKMSETGIFEKNQDSIKNRLNHFESFLSGMYAAPPPPLKETIKFEPPRISE
ncbi:hypothetical protein D0T84_12945 [Dysgonomonas sp. 521]|uniref:hypothetical protein n=1 Tax=Dysgonomonas sp. 521 TaxID=2302932 RepID=UPI0013D8A98C|nr:hypothetical protein [Dysgonomonas sp. 521]NDV95810.1 hypothetical protein [Dysgonomonas sp. 521]